MKDNKKKRGNKRQLSWSILIVAGLIFLRFFMTSPKKAEWFARAHFLGVPLLSILFLYLERRNLSDFFISKDNLGRSILDGCFLIPIFVILSTIYALFILKASFALVPPVLIPILLFVGILGTGITEELVIRGFFMGYLCRLGFSKMAANLVQSIIFIAWHWYWFTERNLWMIANVTIFAPLAGYITLKRKNLAGAFILHVGESFIVNLFFYQGFSP